MLIPLIYIRLYDIHSPTSVHYMIPECAVLWKYCLIFTTLELQLLFFLNLYKFIEPSEVLEKSYGTGVGICEFLVVWYESGKREILNEELRFTEHKSIAVFFK